MLYVNKTIKKIVDTTHVTRYINTIISLHIFIACASETHEYTHAFIEPDLLQTGRWRILKRPRDVTARGSLS